MDATSDTLARLRRFIRTVEPETKAVDLVVPAVRTLLAAAGVPFRLAGGIAVVHHGYARLTDDVDVFVDLSGANRLDELLSKHGFVRERADRLRHVATGVEVDLLVAGSPMPRPGCPPYPSFQSVEPSASDAGFVGLAPLIELKLHAHRHKDLADVVELLKRMDDAHYVEIEAAVALALRSELATLRRDALEEFAFQAR